MASIKIRNVSKSYGDTQVLSNVSLDIEDGEFVALLGPSGCGKTTLLRIIAGLEEPDSGSVTLGDRDVTQLDPTERNVAFVFQSYALYPHKTVYENIAFPLRMRSPWTMRIPFASRLLAGRRQLEREIEPQVKGVARQLGISGCLNRKPGALSGGQCQRVALARALVRQPVAFLMDEPLSNLDAKLRASMRVDISELQRRFQATFVYVTHDQVEAMTMANRIALMHDCTIQQFGPPLALYDNPLNRFVAEFIGSPAINLLELDRQDDNTPRLEGARIRDLPAAIAHAVAEHDNRLWLGVRPDFVRIVPSDASGVDCVVRLIEPLGNEAFMAVSRVYPVSEHDDERRIVIRVDPETVATYSLGDKIRISPDWRRVFCFDADGERVEPEEARYGMISPHCMGVAS